MNVCRYNRSFLWYSAVNSGPQKLKSQNIMDIENKIALHTTDLMDDLGIKNKNVDINFSAQSMLRV